VVIKAVKAKPKPTPPSDNANPDGDGPHLPPNRILAQEPPNYNAYKQNSEPFAWDHHLMSEVEEFAAHSIHPVELSAVTTALITAAVCNVM
jgi:hypothetical protein